MASDIDPYMPTVAADIPVRLLRGCSHQVALGHARKRIAELEAALAAEREACASICDREHEDPGDGPDAVLTRAAAAIRARGNL